MKNLTTGMACLVAIGWTFVAIAPAEAQILGARPGYANGLMKKEHDRQKFQANLHALKTKQTAQSQATGATK